jgi:hypothetical protein
MARAAVAVHSSRTSARAVTFDGLVAGRKHGHGRQASQLLEVLLADRPEEIRAAWKGLQGRRGEESAVRKTLAAHREIETVERTRARLDFGTFFNPPVTLGGRRVHVFRSKWKAPRGLRGCALPGR